MWYNLSLRGFNFPLGSLYKLGVYTKNVTVSNILYRCIGMTKVTSI